jgi:hypothetical protein
MFKCCPEKETIDSKRDNHKFSKSNPSSDTKKFESFIENLIAHNNNKNHREDDISVNEDSSIYPVESENNI